ncbi:MAG: hypothetical protein COY46_00980, partial [Chloroflexi bacterium CG_4_10_14_0_8_um_filter_46_9]
MRFLLNGICNLPLLFWLKFGVRTILCSARALPHIIASPFVFLSFCPPIFLCHSEEAKRPKNLAQGRLRRGKPRKSKTQKSKGKVRVFTNLTPFIPLSFKGEGEEIYREGFHPFL